MATAGGGAFDDACAGHVAVREWRATVPTCLAGRFRLGDARWTLPLTSPGLANSELDLSSDAYVLVAPHTEDWYV